MEAILTGATGFLGRYINDELAKIGFVTSISRNGSILNLDLVKSIPNLPCADLVVHCAGKAHSIPKTMLEKQEYYNVNVIGTANLLKGLDKLVKLPQSFVLISTVAVYGCEKGVSITEEQSLNAKDAYGSSKIQSEKLVKEWCADNNVICTVLRLPLLVGENPPGNLGSMIKGISMGYYFNIAGGKAKKSMVLAADVAKLIPVVSLIGGTYNLTDGYHPSFAELSRTIAKQLGKNETFNLPFYLAKVIASIGDVFGNNAPINSNKLNKITSDLTFNDDKARRKFNWKPSLVLDNFKVNYP